MSTTTPEPVAAAPGSAAAVLRADVAVSPVPSPALLLAILATVNFVNILEFMMVMPLGPFFSTSLAIEPSDLGLLAAAYTLAAAVSGIVCSRFVDRFDRRTALLAAAVGLATATGGAIFASGLHSLLAARVVAGLFGGPASALVMSIVGDAFPASQRGRATGTVMASFSVASVVGVPMSLLCAETWGWWAPFAMTAGIGAAVCLMAWRVLPPLRGHLTQTRAAGPTLWTLLLRREVRLGWGAAAMAMVGTFSIVPFLSPYLVFNLHVPKENLDVLYMWGGLAALGGLIVFGQLTDRVGALPVLLFGVVLHVTTVVLFVLDPHPELPLALLFILFMVGGTSRMIPLQAMSSRVVPPQERGRYMSAQNAVQHLAISAAALLVSWLISAAPDKALVNFDRSGWVAIASNALLVAAAVALALWIARTRKSAAHAPH